MSEQESHPSADQLSAFGLGHLSPETATAIEEHISICEPCCKTLSGLASDDTFVALLKDADQPEADQTLDSGSTARSSASMPLIPAPLVSHARYEVHELVGKGGMGDVFRARHQMMDRTVALKVINRDLVRKPAAIDRFHREVKAAARLSHPNIVTAYDAEQADDLHFLVMEYVDGTDLSRIVKEQGPLPVETACDYIKQAATGLQHAHELGMVHRDIKPHNLMVTDNGIVKILDFGLASLAPVAASDIDEAEPGESLTMAGSIMGTPDFISPEQAEDAHQVDIRSDIYSLGTTLYFLLSGKPPFAEGSVMHKLNCHAQVEPEPIQNIQADAPDELAEVLRRMMAKDANERFQTPAEVADALAPFVDRHRSHAPPPKKPLAETSRGYGSPRFWKRLAVAVLSLIIGLGAATLIYVQTDYGTVRILVEDADANVVLRCDDGHRRIDIEDYDITIGLRSGDSSLHIRHGDLEFETDKFSVRRGDKVVVRVSRVAGTLEVRAGDTVIGRKDLPRKETVPSQAEIAALLKDAALVMTFEKETFAGTDKYTVRDLSGSGNNGTCLGKTTWRPGGKNGGALALEGGGLKFERPLVPGSGSFTVAGWFKLGEPTGPAGLGRWHVYDERLDSGETDLNLTIQNGGLELGHRYPEKHYRNQAMALHTFPGRGPWFFAAWTIDAHRHFTSTINELSVSSANPGPPQRQQGTTRDAVIGRGFNGMMDDVAMFNRALSKEKLSKLYRYGLAGHSLPVSPMRAGQEEPRRNILSHFGAL